MVLIPMGADQIHNATRCQALGVAHTLDALSSSPEMIRDAVTAVMDAPSYRACARRLKAEIETLPEPTHAVTLLEQLHATKQAVVSN